MTTRIPIRTILLSLLAAVLLLALQAGAARADFELPAFDVTEDGSSYSPQATFDSAGGAHFMWGRSSVGMQTRTRGASGTLGPVQTIAGPTATDQQLAADAAGNVQFVWRSKEGAEYIARTRRLHADGTLGPTVDLSSAGFDAWSPQLAVDAAGGIVFTWIRSIDTGAIVQARRMAPDGTLGPVENISQAGWLGGNSVAVDDEGNAVIAWSRNDGSYFVSQARRWAADGTRGPINDVSETGAHSATVRVGMDGAGVAHFAFVRGEALLMRRMSVGGILSPAQDLRALPTEVAHDPWLAVDPAGRAQVVWRVISSISGNAIQTRRERRDGSLGPVQTLGDYSPDVPPDPRVALDAQGTAHHVWVAEVGSKKVIMARSRAADGSLGALQQLSESISSGLGGDAAHPEVTAGANGRALATWTWISPAGPELVQGAVLPPDQVAGDGDASGTSPAPAEGGTNLAPAGGSAEPAESDRLAPKLSGLAVQPARLVVRRRGRVAFTLSEPSAVVMRVVRRGAGRRVVGRLRATGVAGKNKLTFPRRLRGHYLRPGRYQLVAVATDGAGNRSAAARARFRVIRG